jgi:hypothetical protein
MTKEQFESLVRVKVGCAPNSPLPKLSAPQQAAYLIHVEGVRTSEAALKVGISIKSADNARRLFDRAEKAITKAWIK